MIVFGDGVEFAGVGDFEFATDSHGRVFSPKPAGPISGFEAFEFVSLGAWVEEDEVGDFRFELAELLGEDGAHGGAGERWAGGVAALEEVDAFGVFLGLGFHRANDGELVGDGGALWQEFGEVGAGDVCGDGFERSAGGGAGFGVPGFELAGSAAEPKEDTVFLFLLGDPGEGGSAEEAGEAHAGDGSGGEALQELTAVDVVVRGAAVLGWIGGGHFWIGL